MASTKIRNSIAVAVCFLSTCVTAQDQMDICYGPGSVVGAVLGTLIITLCFLASCFFLYKMYWKSRKGKHLVLMSDAENPNDQYAFDNPCFREATPIKHNIQEEKQSSKLDKNKWLGWSPLHSFGKEQKSEKLTSMDDSYLNDSRMKVVTLKSHDFTGLGFNICGNMRDGIFVKDVLHRGPAFESGCINPGDRINSVCINFRNMVFEDALAILSYASPYDVQLQVENDSYSRPSTLIRSKRESNAVTSTEIIRHPKYNRSQSISHLNEIGKNNKGVAHQIDFMLEKNRINQSLNKSQDYHGGSNDYPTIKLSPSVTDPKKENQKLEKNAMMKTSPMIQNKKSPKTNAKERESTSEQASSGDPQNKLQKFGIKVLPISINPKMGVQSVTGTKKVKDPPKSPPTMENEINTIREKPEKPVKPKLQDTPTRGGSPAMESTKEPTGLDEPDANKENVKGMLAKGFHNLKEKINQNTLGKKKNRDTGNESNADDDSGVGFKTNVTVTVNKEDKSPEDISENDCPVPKLRSTVACGVKAYEKNQHHSQTSITIPEEVSRAGDVARNNRKSITDPVTVSTRKSVTSLVMEPEEENLQGRSDTLEKKVENASDSDSSSERGSFRTSDETKKPKKSKGKAPAPPMSVAESSKDGKPSVSSKQPSGISSKEINEIKRESDLVKDEKTNIFEPTHSDTRTISLRDSNDEEDRINHLPSYDSDSDTEPRPSHLKERPENTKIELNATQVTIHQGPSSDGNDEDIEPSRKAASLGDLSKLDSEQPLSIVLERAVSLDLADGASQCGKKRKAPLPPSEEFPAVFDDLNYRKEPRLENSLGLNTFQRRLKKSSDFGTLEDALYDGPKSLEIEVNKHISPLDLTETYNSNIQEFSSWLAECRRPKGSKEEVQEEVSKPTRMHSTSLVNINSSESLDKVGDNEDTSQFEFQGNNVSFSVNGKNFPDFQVNEKVSTNTQNVNFPGSNSRTVVVISQPNSLDPTVLETVPLNYSQNEETPQKTKEPSNESPGRSQSVANEDDTTPEHFVTASESRIESFKSSVEDDETPPKLPTSPMPIMSTSSTLSSPLSSSLTYITEIKVSTSEKDVDNDSRMSKESESLSPSLDSVSGDDNEVESTAVVSSTPLAINRKPGSVKALSERIEKFDSKPFESKSFVISPINSRSNTDEVSFERKDSNDSMKQDNQTVFESSRIPIRAMKSETGQKVLATIQSLAAKESSPTKTPELEYARRVASLFSGNNSPEKIQGNVRKQTEIIENEINRPNISGFYLKSSGTSPPKPSKDFFPTRKVPPVVPPRKMETSLTNKSTVSVELPATNQGTGQTIINEKMIPSEPQERNIVTFSSFMPKNQTEDTGTSSVISFKIKEHGEINGGHLHGQDSVMPIKTSATKIVFESKDNKDDF